MIRRTVNVNNPEEYRVGDIIAFELNDGEPAEAMAVKETDKGMLFIFVDCLKKEYPMNQEDSNRGGYEASDLREKLNSEIIDRFPANIRSKMIAFPNGDFLRLPTEKEIFGVNKYGEEEADEITQFEPMKLRRNRIAFRHLNGDWEWYWLQNKSKFSAAYFAYVYSFGFASYDYASNAFGVRPVFLLNL